MGYTLPELATTFELRNEAQILDFVEEHASLAGLLSEAQAKIAEVFGPETRVALELVTDMDSPNEVELFALIGADMSVEEARARMNRLDEDWWLDAVTRTDGLMNIDVEFT